MSFDCVAQRIASLTEADIAARMRSERYKGEAWQTIFLDGEPILELHDVTMETVREGEAWIMRVNQNSRMLGKAVHRPPEVGSVLSAL
jgi:hypothetical protein